MKRRAPAAAAVLSVMSLVILQGASPAGAETPTVQPRTVVPGAAAGCARLVGLHIGASKMELPTRGAEVVSATLTKADPQTGRPEFCLVRGKVNSFDTAAPGINFQLNLPTSWNRKAIQFGGGGFNGTVVTGLDPLPGYSNDLTISGEPPIDRGYATFGSDGGVAVGNNPPGSFALNKEALANYSGESVKRTHDAALGVLRHYYGSPPREQYYAGGSKGGHEALVAAQRYGDDYDGIIAFYPASQNQAMVLSWYHMWQQAYSRPGGYLDPAHQKLVTDAVYATCDSLDGVKDGVISDVRGCDRAFSVASLRCPDGAQGDGCLSQQQIDTLETAATPYRFAFPLANGVTEIGPYPVLRGADFLNTLLDSTGNGENTAYYLFTDPVIRYFIEQDPTGSSQDFDYRRYESRVRELSREYDATDPDIDRFRQHGGKLIIVQGTTDMLVPEGATDAYYQSLTRRYGASTAGFVRYYVQPGYNHGVGSFDLSWDSLTALENWTDRGTPPADPVATDANPTTLGRTLPLCAYPKWPSYNGTGDVDQAKNYACVSHRGK
ncbi:tannase/feruloyl esterase family alpha/beta hydrolase [Streptomyces sp. NPDC004237]|uniref:tannase/feruloyl esterase family alpha/beta hydrolase n=1 Tax=Streptomyces sp. NPDC004237 TaxID=3154455 RepID=UPI00339FA865